MCPRKALCSPVILLTVIGYFAATTHGQVLKHWNSLELNPDWSTPAYWSPIGNPTAVDGARLGGLPGIENRIVNLDQDITIASLEILNGMTLQGNYDSLNVTGDTVVSGVNDGIYESRLLLGFPGNEPYTFQTEGLSINDGAYVRLQADAVANVFDQIFVDTDSELRCDAEINLFGNGSRTLINNGLIRAGGGGLEIFQYGSGLVDLDGNFGWGVVQLDSFDSELTIHGSELYDSFGGDLAMINSAILSMDLNVPWVINTGGYLSVSHGVSGESAVIDGQHLQFSGTMHLLHDETFGGGQLLMNADTTFTGTANVFLEPGTLLDIAGTSVVEGGEFIAGENAFILFRNDTVMQSGFFQTYSDDYTEGRIELQGSTQWDGQVSVDGVLRQNGNATVSGSTVVNADVFDMDGTGIATWQIHDGLTVNAKQIDFGDDGFDATMNLFATLSLLNINLEDEEAWVLEGVLNLGNSLHFPVTRLGGTPIEIAGELNLHDGQIRSTAAMTFADTSTLDFAASDVELIVTNRTEIQSGALVTGDGTVVNNSSGHLILGHGSSLVNASLENHGHLEIGTSAGIADVSNYTSSSTAHWEVEIGGPVSGTEHDLLLVGNGDAELAGTLCVQLVDLGGGLFVPEIGDEFTVLSAVGGIVGQFENVPVSIAGGNAYQWEVMYGFNEVRLALADIIPNVYLGDVNQDGVVNLLDVAPFVDLLNSGGYMLQADINCDGAVDLLDVAPFIDLLTS